MEILVNHKARILLKEGSRAMAEYGISILGCIKEVTEVAKNQVEMSLQIGAEKILFIIDEFGERVLIPYGEVRSISYV